LAARSGAVSAWTGSEWLVVGGIDGHGTPLVSGAAFRPATGRWEAMAPAPFPLGPGSTAAWTGRELVVLSGAGTTPGAAGYDPADNRWQRLSAPPGTATIGSAVSAGDGVAVLRTGAGVRPGGARGVAAEAYHLTGDRWSALGAPGVTAGLDVTLEWAGHTLVALSPSGSESGARYQPGAGGGLSAGGRWQPLAAIPRALRADASLGGPPTPAGPMAIYWGGGTTGLVYDGSNGRWEGFPAGDLAPRQDPATAWTGSRLLAWGGARGPTPLGDGVAYSPTG
jgi:hypothetical protein